MARTTGCCCCCRGTTWRALTLLVVLVLLLTPAAAAFGCGENASASANDTAANSGNDSGAATNDADDEHANANQQLVADDTPPQPRFVPLDIRDPFAVDENDGDDVARTVDPELAVGVSAEPPQANPEEIAALIARLDEASVADDQSRQQLIEAMLALAEYGPGAAAAFAALREVLVRATAEPEVRSVAAFALGRLGEAAAPAVDDLMLLLADDADASVRQAAAYALGQIGPEAGPSATLLRRRLEQDPDSQVRAVAAHALTRLGEAAVAPLLAGYEALPAERRAYRISLLGRIGPAAVDALPHLEAALADDNRHVATAAAEALGRLGSAAAPAVPALLRAMHEHPAQSEEVATMARFAVRHLGTVAVPAIVTALEQAKQTARGHEAHARRIALIDLLGELGAQAHEAVETLAQDLGKEEPLAVRVAAANALGRIGVESRQALGNLRRALLDESGMLRAAAARALAQLGETGVEALGRTLRYASASDVELHEVLIMALFELGEDAAPAVEGLTEALRRDTTLDSTLRYTVVRILYLIGRPARGATPLLIRALHDRDSAVAETAAEALGAIGRPALRALPAMFSGVRDGRLGYLRTGQAIAEYGADAVPSVLARVDDSDERVRATALEALGRIGAVDERILPALIVASHDADTLVRAAAVRAMLRLQDAAATEPAAVQALLKRIGPEESEQVIRLAALRTLGHSGEQAYRAVGAMAAQLDDESAAVRREAASALAVLGRAAEPAAEKLARVFFEDPQQEVAEAASVALIALGPVASFAVERLTEELFHEQERRRIATARILAEMGEAATQALPALIEALSTDAHPLARAEVALALGMLGEAAAEAVPALIDALDHPVVAPRAIQALGRIGPAAAEATEPLLTALIEEQNKQYVLLILEALANIGPAAEAAIEPLLHIATAVEDDPALSEATARALRRIRAD